MENAHKQRRDPSAACLLLKQYLEANAGRNRIVKRRELEQLLEEHDMPVEKKTLYADFAALGDVCGLQLEYDVHKKGCGLTVFPELAVLNL